MLNSLLLCGGQSEDSPVVSRGSLFTSAPLWWREEGLHGETQSGGQMVSTIQEAVSLFESVYLHQHVYFLRLIKMIKTESYVCESCCCQMKFGHGKLQLINLCHKKRRRKHRVSTFYTTSDTCVVFEHIQVVNTVKQRKIIFEP